MMHNLLAVHSAVNPQTTLGAGVCSTLKFALIACGELFFCAFFKTGPALTLRLTGMMYTLALYSFQAMRPGARFD